MFEYIYAISWPLCCKVSNLMQQKNGKTKKRFKYKCTFLLEALCPMAIGTKLGSQIAYETFLSFLN